MQNLPIVYIGPKAQKKDTVAKTGYVFKRLQPLLVPYQAALTLLKHPTVWIHEKDLTDELIEESNALVEQAEKRKTQQAIAAEDIDTSKIGGNEDLMKELEVHNTKASLDKWMEDNDIELEFEDKDTMTYRREAILKEVERLIAAED